MKKVFLAFLLITGVTNLFAQYERFSYYTQPQQSELMFNTPKPGNFNAIFSFTLNKNNKVLLEMNDVHQLQFLPNLDSLLKTVQQNLKQLQDSLKSDGLVRRIDYSVSYVGSPKIRITTHHERPNNFTFQNNELVQLKVDSDTLRILLHTNTGYQFTFTKDGNRTKADQKKLFSICFLLNNFSDLETIPETTLSQCVQLVKANISKDLEKKTKYFSNSRYRAFYDLKTSKLTSPSKEKWIKQNYGNRKELVPNMYLGYQFVRGVSAPSLAVGLRYTSSNSIITNRFYAMWQPYFSFTKDGNNKTIAQRNDFLTFHYIELEKNKIGVFDFVSNFSIGYLINRQGDWFEPNTFKIGIPGVRSGWLQIEPEFFFNNFFKNFSPSLKLTLHYE